MKRLLAITLLVLSLPAFAASIVMRAQDTNGDYVRLFDKPCANDIVLARTPSDFRPNMRAGEGSFGGKIVGMCWLALPDGTIGMLYDDGDQGRMPMDAFKIETNS